MPIKLKTVNEKLLEQYIRHSVYIERLKAGEAKLISEFLKRKTFPQLYKKLISEIKRLEKLGTPQKITAFRKRLEQMLIATQKLSTAGMVKAEAMLINRLVNVSKFEANWNKGLLKKTVPLAYDFTMPSNTVLKNLVNTVSFDGHKLSAWMKGYSNALKVDMMKQIKVGIATGESLTNIGTRISNVLGYKTKQAEYIARTAVCDIVHKAREEVFENNQDVIKGVQWVSTLDDRTTEICIALDGKTFEIGEGERPPAHFNCRSTIVPYLGSWKEFGIKAPPPAMRASMQGEVPARMTYKDWFKKQSKETQIEVLGKTKAELYRSGKIKIEQFVDKDYKPLTVEQLMAKI